MFIGHFAVAFASKRAAPELSLGTAFAAAQLLDLIWPVLVLTGVERVTVQPGITVVTPLLFEHYPWSHSLLTTVIWAALFGCALLLRGRPRRVALVAALLVTSHFVLDWVSHRPDLPLTPWGDVRLGLGLWQSLPATVVVELLLFAAGVIIYARSTAPHNRAGRYGLMGLLAFLLIVHMANMFGPQAPAGTPPAAIAGPALAMWLIVGWAAWIDRGRSSRVQP